jgi:hypothetical protein
MNGNGVVNASVAHSSGEEPCSDDEHAVVCFQSMIDVDSMRSPELDANSTAQQAIGSSLIIKLNELPLAERESHLMTCLSQFENISPLILKLLAVDRSSKAGRSNYQHQIRKKP